MSGKNRYEITVPKDKVWAMEGLAGDLGILRGSRHGKMIIEADETVVKVLQTLLSPAGIIIEPES